MDKEQKYFICKSKKLADYLINHGSKLNDSYCEHGKIVFEFEYDETIDANLELWEANKRKWLF